MLSTTLNGVTLLAPTREGLAHVTSWYDGLEDSEVKRAIVKLRWRESKSTRSPWLRIYVLLRHPNREEVASLKSACEIGMSADIDQAVDKLMGTHKSWVESHAMPNHAPIDGREVEIFWFPEELPPVDPDTLPPQERAEYEINSNTLELLYLVYVATLPMDELVSTFVGTDTPFLSAGFIVEGSLSVLKHCPSGFASSQDERDALHDRILECPSDLIILLRLAAHLECKQPLITRVIEAMSQFCNLYRSQIPSWLAQYRRNEEDDENPDDRSAETPLIDPKSYLALDEAGEAFKKGLIEAVTGHEPEIALVLNDLLSTLPIPESPFDDDDY